ncbi:MAG: S8 family peptidase [Candidatus Aminicenantes bacterium]|nr:S8 family peptidase [Candidatus Aminicenantes bacterium]
MKKIFFVTLLIYFFLVCAFAVNQEFSDPAGRPALVPDEIIVKYDSWVKKTRMNEILDKYGLLKKADSFKKGDFVVLRHTNPTAILDRLKKERGVVYAEQNGYAYMAITPNDQYFSYMWNMVKINMPAAWDVSTGSGAIVAVIDTGVKQSLADFAKTHFTAGYDFVNHDTDPADDQGHGSHVTGTIAQSTNNNIGVPGIAYDCAIMPVKVLNSAGSGTYDQIANGVAYAADNGAHILNLSLGGVAGSTALQNAVDYAWAKGCLIVCAAGNNNSTAPFYPAAYADSFSVGATNYNDQRAGYSNYGVTVDISAPGGDAADWNGCGYPEGILQGTFGTSGDGYYFLTGTSMASAHVAGLAALLKSQDPARTNVQIRDIIEATAVDLGTAGWDSTFGWGRINAYAALTYTPPSQPTTRTPQSTL